MLKTIKKTISEFRGEDLYSDIILTKLATQIITDMDAAVDKTNLTQTIFSRHGMALLYLLDAEITKQKIENKCPELYEKIIELCLPYNSGITMLTLAECFIAIIAASNKI